MSIIPQSRFDPTVMICLTEEDGFPTLPTYDIHLIRFSSNYSSNSAMLERYLLNHFIHNNPLLQDKEDLFFIV